MSRSSLDGIYTRSCCQITVQHFPFLHHPIQYPISCSTSSKLASPSNNDTVILYCQKMYPCSPSVFIKYLQLVDEVLPSLRSLRSDHTHPQQLPVCYIVPWHPSEKLVDMYRQNDYKDEPGSSFQWFELRPWILCKYGVFIMISAGYHPYLPAEPTGIFLFHHMIHNEQIIHRKAAHCFCES